MLPRSIWFQNTPLPPSEPLTADVACDVAIIGGGIAGLAAAYELLPETKRVVVIEQGQIAGGSTGWSGGFLINAEGFDAKEMLDKWGPERGRELYDTNHAALERLASAITTENISCDFKKTGAYYVAAEKSHLGKVYEEY